MINLAATKHEHRYRDVAQHTQLHGLFENTVFPLGKRRRSFSSVANSVDVDFCSASGAHSRALHRQLLVRPWLQLDRFTARLLLLLLQQLQELLLLLRLLELLLLLLWLLLRLLLRVLLWLSGFFPLDEMEVYSLGRNWCRQSNRV
jgi:hypothetical protein